MVSTDKGNYKFYRTMLVTKKKSCTSFFKTF